MVGDAQDDKALAGADRLSEFAGFEREGFVFQFLGEIVAFEVAEIATLFRGRAVGFLAGELVELGPGLELLIDIVGFGIGGGHLLGGRLRQRAWTAWLRLGRVGIGGDQDFTEADALGLGKSRTCARHKTSEFHRA